MQQSLPTRVIQMPMAIGALYVVCIGLDGNIDQIYITMHQLLSNQSKI
jgi:hypothetical protein